MTLSPELSEYLVGNRRRVIGELSERPLEVNVTVKHLQRGAMAMAALWDELGGPGAGGAAPANARRAR